MARRTGRWLLVLRLGLDMAGAFFAWLAALVVAGQASWSVGLLAAMGKAGVLSLLTVVVMGMFRLYQDRGRFVRSTELGRLVQAGVVCGLGLALLSRTQHLGPSTKVALLGGTYCIVAVACIRSGYSAWLRICRARGVFCQRVCVLGSNSDAATLVEMLRNEPELGYRVVAMLDPADWLSRAPGSTNLGRDMAAMIRRSGASVALVAANAVDPPDLDELLRRLAAERIEVQISTGLSRVGHHRVHANSLSHQLFLCVEKRRLTLWQSVLKRVIDIVMASLALMVTAPIVLVAALSIKLCDGGPVFYRQERVGRDGRLFRLVKLRTMDPDSSSKLDGLIDLNERNGPLFKLSHDPRVTRVGRFLRATSIDELPQLANVLRGEMSLVGPRPALPSEVAQFDLELLERSSVPPGITGLWQVEARDDPSFDAYRRLDLFYIDNWSVVMDIMIMVTTIAVVSGRAVRALRGGGDLVVRDSPVPAEEEAVSVILVGEPE